MDKVAASVHGMANLKKLLMDVLDLEGDFAENAHFMKDLGLSSLMALEVMTKLEKTYAVKFKEEDVKKLTTLSNVYAALVEKNAKLD